MNQPFNPPRPNPNATNMGRQPNPFRPASQYPNSPNPFRTTPDSHPATAPQQPVQVKAPQPVYQPQRTASPAAKTTSRAMKRVFVFIVVLLLGIIFALGSLVYQMRTTPLAGYATNPQQAQTLPNSAPAPAQKSTEKKARPTQENFRSPYPIPVNEAASSGAPAGNFTKIFRSEKASAPFALEVAQQWRAKALSSGGNYNTSVTAYSPVTHQKYVMSCVDEGSYIHCRGGNDAHVFIS